MAEMDVEDAPPPPPPPPPGYPPKMGTEEKAHYEGPVESAVVHVDSPPPIKPHRGSCVVCCALAGPCIAFFTIPGLFFFGMTANGRIGSGWALFVAGLWTISVVELVSTGLRECGTDKETGWLSFIALGSGAAKLLLTFLALIMLPADYFTKCATSGNLLENRALSLAFPFDCGTLSMDRLCPDGQSQVPGSSASCSFEIGPYGQGVTMWAAWGYILLIFIVKAVTLCFQAKEAMTAMQRAQSNFMNIIIGVVTFTVAFACVCPSYAITDLKTVDGRCPSNDGLPTRYWLDQPKHGAELPECTWRAFQGDGTCVAYPYDYPARNQSWMYDPMLGRKTYSSSHNDQCATEKGLLSCAQYSPYAADFIGGPFDVPAFKVTVCQEQCQKICDACGCSGPSASWCTSNLEVDVPSSNTTTGCWNSAGHTAPQWLSIAVVTATAFFVSMYSTEW